MESQSLPGWAVIKIFFYPNAKIEAAVAQLAASSQSVLHSLPAGIFPPAILRYNASSVPILQLSISSETMSEQAIYDYGYNFIRTQMATVQGASFPLPFGGQPRQIMVDIDPRALYAQGPLAERCGRPRSTRRTLSCLPAPPRSAAANIHVRLNSSPECVEAFNNLPVKQTNGSTIYIARRRACPRRICGADEHRAAQRQPRARC